MNDNWNLFCEISKKNYNEKEDKVQKVFEQIFAVLFGYYSFDGEIDSQRVLHIGSTDRVIPDIIIRDSSDNKDLFIVELKQLNLRFDKKYEEQLLSYMRLLSLNIGVLICDAIYIYVLENDKFSSSKIEIDTDNKKGEEFIDMFSKGGFSSARIKNFVLTEQQFVKNVQKIKDALKELDIKDVVKLYFASDFEEVEIDEALKNILFVIEEKLPFTPPDDASDVDPDDPIIASNESIQNWIKRIFVYLFRNKILTEQEIYNLHDVEYSKRTFGIAYAMLVDRQSDTIISGHVRYWQKRIDRYYVCSQWWKPNDKKYDVNIRRWLNKVFPDYRKHGLDRRT